MPKTSRHQKDLLTLGGVRSFVKDQCEKAWRPCSVYQLWVNPQFTFRQAAEAVPYLRALNVDTVYLPPFLKAVPGSLHGYNITNPHQINPELGTEEDFNRFCERLQEHHIRLIADIVPNHMGINSWENQWWMDVLENGPSSIYARFFDIDWESEKTELRNKVLIPVLGDHYGRVLERGELELHFTGNEFHLRYWEHKFPIAPRTYTFILEYGIGNLRQEFGDGDAAYSELLSVITAFKNLPHRSECTAERIEERNREKQIAKKRLGQLVSESKEVREFIQSRVQIFNGRKEDPSSFDLLDQLLSEQAYRMAFWRVAAEEINYRRFFDVNELAALRIEDARVFEIHHQFIFRLLREGKIHGLRIDHPDGLYDPPEYFKRLQRTYLFHLLRQEFEEVYGRELGADSKEERAVSRYLDQVLSEEGFQSAKPLFVVAEKILDRKETLPPNWNIDGTVGYDYLNLLNGLFVDREKGQEFEEIYREFIGHPIYFDQLVYERKKFFALVHMSSEINTLAHRLDQISERNRRYRDFTRHNLAVAIREVIACFPVYRTYIAPEVTEVSERDEKYIHIAVEKAKRKTPALSRAIYDFLRDILLLRLVPEMSPEEERLYRDFILRFQQLTGPIMAKGLEDTCFYIYNRLISLNEVGGDPEHFGISTGDFHRQNAERQKKWPQSFLSSSTHDTKRSEDVRMRVNVLSELSAEWKANLAKWVMANEKHKTLLDDIPYPDRNTEYFLYQTLLGAWPLEEMDDTQYESFKERIWNYTLKSIREAKLFTNWVNPNPDFEEMARKFVEAVLSRNENNRYLDIFLPFQQKVSRLGMLNALSALVLKIGSPGVVNTYQGTENWNLRLVDPDNRQPVDFGSYQKALHDVSENDPNRSISADRLGEWMRSFENGAIKRWILFKGLSHRSQNPDLYIEGHYVPLQAEGERERNVVAFMRQKNDQRVIVAAARFFTELADENGSFEGGSAVWKDTKIMLPKDYEISVLRNIYTGETIQIQKGGENPFLRASDLFSTLPGVVLEAE